MHRYQVEYQKCSLFEFAIVDIFKEAVPLSYSLFLEWILLYIFHYCEYFLKYIRFFELCILRVTSIIESKKKISIYKNPNTILTRLILMLFRFDDYLLFFFRWTVHLHVYS